MTSSDWAASALDSVLDRVAEGRGEVGSRFPLFADPATGRWTTTGRGAWTGGFWAGLLWLRARRTGAAEDRAAAASCTVRLAPWAGADTATRGLILWYGTALAPDEPAAVRIREEGAAAVLADVDPVLGVVPWGSAFGGPRLVSRADAVPGLVPLLAGAGPGGPEAAAAQLRGTLGVCLGGHGGEQPPDGRLVVPAWVHEADGSRRACEDPPAGWSRGRAWLLLAVADALLRPAVAAVPAGPGEPAWPLAEVAGALLAGGVPPGPDGPSAVPPANERVPDGPLDTSAAAITAVALLKLALAAGPGAAADRYTGRASAVLRRLTRHHLSGPGQGRPPGMLLDGCYDAAGPTAVRHELIWGDFFLALGLAALTGRVCLREV
ncbi:sugar ABC transporter permease [Streptomyces sp. CAU 1734]|uniref:sugar ABC transporter permease n=1 Tax=Streptomyces sp. CAU 1734 TaxID=3140360 RepID=UPI003260A23B